MPCNVIHTIPQAGTLLGFNWRRILFLFYQGNGYFSFKNCLVFLPSRNVRFQITMLIFSLNFALIWIALIFDHAEHFFLPCMCVWHGFIHVSKYWIYFEKCMHCIRIIRVCLFLKGVFWCSSIPLFVNMYMCSVYTWRYDRISIYLVYPHVWLHAYIFPFFSLGLQLIVYVILERDVCYFLPSSFLFSLTLFPSTNSASVLLSSPLSLYFSSILSHLRERFRCQ